MFTYFKMCFMLSYTLTTEKNKVLRGEVREFSTVPGIPGSPLAPFEATGGKLLPGGPWRPGSPLSPLPPGLPGTPSLPGNPGSPGEENESIYI